MKSKITATILLMCMIFSQSFTFAFTFEEVKLEDLIKPASMWAQSSIDEAKLAGLITERNTGFYTNEITRVQFAELVVNLVEVELNLVAEPAPENTFTDTVDIEVLKAYNLSIVNGKTKTTFEPNALITREEIAAMLYRAISFIKENSNKDVLVHKGDMSKFTDTALVSTWAIDGVTSLSNNSIMKGTSETTLSPKANATIEQCIIFVNRYHNLYQK